MAPACDDERELMLLACGTAQRRRGAQARMVELCARVNFDRLTRLLLDQRVLPLVGARVSEASPRRLPTAFTSAVADARDRTARDSALLEAVTVELLRRLEESGIRALPLKGPLLGRALYGDPALRASEDVDILVPTTELGAAARIVGSAGWTESTLGRDRTELPQLHRRLIAPRPWLPTVELHWRVHWHESSFSQAMLDRSASCAGAAPRAAALDELAALLLFFARDAFVGLRLTADIAAWWDVRGGELPAGEMDALVAEHPALEPCLAASATVAAQLVGLPTDGIFASPPILGARARRAVRLNNWAGRGDRDQVAANAAMVDGLLTPWRQLPAFFRRQLTLARDGVRRPSPAESALHCAKLLARWLITLARTRRGRRWSPLPADASSPTHDRAHAI